MAVTTPPPGNTANQPGAVVHTAPHRGVVAAARARAGRGETLELIESGRMDAAAAKPSVPPTDARETARPAPEAKPAPREAEPDEEPTEEPREPESVPEVDAAPDAETSKRLATIQATEKRSRDKLVAEKKAAHAELDKRVKALESEWSPRVKAAEDFEALRSKASKARTNPAALADLFRSLGWSDDHFEPTAQALYAMSKAGQADPSRRAHVERLLADREEHERVDATQKRLDELEAKLAAKEHQGEFQRLQTDYLDRAVKAIGDDAPIARALAAKNPAKLRTALWQVTTEMTDELDGEVPEFAAVIARYEETRGAELDEMGIPRPTIDTKKNNQAADKKNPAKTLSADLSTPRVPRSSSSGKEHRAETRRLLESGKLE